MLNFLMQLRVHFSFSDLEDNFVMGPSPSPGDQYEWASAGFWACNRHAKSPILVWISNGRVFLGSIHSVPNGMGLRK